MGSQQTIGQIVADDFRKAAIFKQYGLDFCCGGGRTLAESCRTQGISLQELESALQQVDQQPSLPQSEFNEWSLSFLTDYIVNHYHRYIERTVGPITDFSVKVARVHGERHPELIEVLQTWNELHEELLEHMQKEEKMLFPYIKTLEPEANWQVPVFATIGHPLSEMEMDHEAAGRLMQHIALLTKQYQVPEAACTTYRVLFAMLQEFEEKLYEHVHLENNILFMKAFARERELSEQQVND